MGKIEVSALIKAIQESVSLLVSDGIAPRERITDPVNDAARVQDLESGYSTEIDDIVDNIPDVPPTPPAPTLPTVTADTATVGNKISVQAGSSVNLYKDSALIPYDSTKSYGGRVGNGDGGVSTWQFLFINNSGYLEIKNTTSASIYAFGVSYYICSSNQAEIVFVLNSSDVKYQAFKYTQNGTDYYYVLDGVQSDWTDDLSSIGYSLEPVSLLPTVSTSGDISVGNWTYPVGGTTTLESNTTVVLKNDLSGGSEIAFDTNVCYAVMFWFYNSSNRGTNGSISVVNVNDKLSAKNDTNSSLNFYAAGIAVCSSNHATIITVYDSSNVAFNAFKYTLDGTDYYYVLDQTQTDWTDDLNSIGYSLEPIGLYAYFNGNNPGINTSLFGSSDGTTQYNQLYEKDGSSSTSEMSFDPSYTYTVLHVYKADGTEVSPGGGRFELGDSSNYLRFLFFNGGYSWTAAKIKYTKSSTEMTAYFNSGIKNNQKSVSSSWGPYGGRTELLYPLNSSQFVPYDSTKIYKVKTVFYVNGTNPVTITNDSVTIDDKNMNGNHTGHLMIHTHNPNPATGNVCGCTFTVE